MTSPKWFQLLADWLERLKSTFSIASYTSKELANQKKERDYLGEEKETIFCIVPQTRPWEWETEIRSDKCRSSNGNKHNEKRMKLMPVTGTTRLRFILPHNSPTDNQTRPLPSKWMNHQWKSLPNVLSERWLRSCRITRIHDSGWYDYYYWVKFERRC